MFQFPDDKDIDIEDLLNVSDRHDLPNTSKNTDLSSILDDCTDDELILSVVEDLDNSIQKNCSPDNGRLQRILNGNTHSQHSTRLINETKHKLPLPDTPPASSKVLKIEYERKFPGPAGLIPKTSKNTVTPVKNVQIKYSPQKIDLNTTNDAILFEGNTWSQFLKDLEGQPGHVRNMLHEYSIASVKRTNIILNKSRKIPFFASIIVHIECSLCDPSVVLKDPSGEIRGTLHRDLWEQYNHLLTIGTVMLLRQVSIMNIANSRKPYINITNNNLVTIYTPQEDTENPVLISHISPLTEADYQRKKTERIVFEETHPNKMFPPASSLSRRTPPKIQSVVNTFTSNENFRPIPPPPSFRPKSITIQSAPTLPITPNVNTELILNELEGIDADSLFGEF